LYFKNKIRDVCKLYFVCIYYLFRRFLALLTGKDPADSAPRRMARRGSDYNNNPYSTAAATAAYTSGARPSWNHQILQSFFRNKQPYSLQNVKMNNNKKRSSSFGWVCAQ
jgi:hypothetical protein